MSPVELNLKAVVTATVVGVVALYVLYSLYPKYSGMATSGLKQHLTWKTKPFVDVPSDVKKRAKDIKIIERRETIRLDNEDLTIFFRQANPLAEPKFPVLLLHGMAFTSATWVDKVQSQTDPSVNTINLLAAAGHPVIAVDLPDCLTLGVEWDLKACTETKISPDFGRDEIYKTRGWGESNQASIKESNRAHFLERFIEQTKISRPVIVSPSMSGGFSLPYIMGDPSHCDQRIRGYVPVAPVGTDAYTNSQYHRCEVPVMIVYGTKDVHLGLTSTNNLRNMANNEVVPMQDAKHPCYLDDPDKWHYHLYNFLLAVERDVGGQKI